MNVEIQEPNDLPPNAITDENAHQFEVLVYQQSQDVAGIKRLAIADWKSYLGFNTHKVNNVASYLGIPDNFDWEANEDKTWEDPDQSHYTLSHQVENLATKVGVNTNPQAGFQPILPRVETLENQVQAPNTGLLDKMDEARHDIDSLAEEIGPGTGGGALTTRVNALEDKVGNARDITTEPTGLMLVQEEVEGVDGSGGLMQRMTAAETSISALNTTVGDSTSGLVKDVSDLQTVVGDENSGLVKQVHDLESKVYQFRGSIVSATGDNPTTAITLSNGDVISVPDGLQNGNVFDIKPTAPDEAITINGVSYSKGNNIAWVVPEVGDAYFDELGMNIDLDELNDIKDDVDTLKSYFVTDVIPTGGSWNSSNLKSGIYQFSCFMEGSSSETVAFIITLNDTGTAQGAPVDISNNFATYFEIPSSGYLTMKSSVISRQRKLSIHKIGEI